MAGFDVILKGGRVYDGTGGPWCRADIGIRGDTIAEAGALQQADAEQVIDCTNMAVSPGFIDFHSHSDLMVFEDPSLAPKLMQGVTTELLGQDGIAAAPVRDERKSDWARHLSGLLGTPAVDSRECLGAVVSNGRIFYTSQASGLMVSQTYGEASRDLLAVWER